MSGARAVFRPACSEDAPQLAQIHLQSWQAVYRGVLSAGYLADLAAGVDRRAERLSDAISHARFSIWVAQLDEHPVAWASFGPSRDADALPGTGELRAINLLPQVWAQGIGKALWQHVRQGLISTGHDSATVWVIQGNQRALGFYQSLGFVRQPDTAATVVENREPLPLVRYRIDF